MGIFPKEMKGSMAVAQTRHWFKVNSPDPQTGGALPLNYIAIVSSDFLASRSSVCVNVSAAALPVAAKQRGMNDIGLLTLDQHVTQPAAVFGHARCAHDFEHGG